MRGLRRRGRRQADAIAPPPPADGAGPLTGRRTLLAGWFSFPQFGATAGDLLVRDTAEQWLREAGHVVDVANDPPFAGGVDWRRVDPREYDHVVFVCGPFPRTWFTERFVARFWRAKLVGLNLTMLERLDEWNPFDELWERDSDRTVRPDLALMAQARLVPVAGLCLVERQWEHAGPLHEQADAALERLARSRPLAVVPIDTRLDRPGNPLRTPEEVASVIARMDVVLTTRLHGTIFSLRHGVPPLVVDPIHGGAKVLRQAERLEWPARFTADALDDAALGEALEWCLSDEARVRARACRDRALEELLTLREEATAALARSRQGLA